MAPRLQSGLGGSIWRVAPTHAGRIRISKSISCASGMFVALDADKRHDFIMRRRVWTHTPPNKPDRPNRLQPLDSRERVGEAGVRGLTAAVGHPGRRLF